MTATPDNRSAQLSTRVAFLVTGVGFSSLAPLIPGIKALLHLDDATLGLLLLCVGFGSILVMPFAGGLTGRYGCRRVIITSALVLCLSMPVIAFAKDIPLLAVGLLLMGAGGGTLDVAMNIQAVIVERESEKPMMSGFHGLFSVGCIVGAGGLTVLLGLGVGPVFSQVILSGICMFMLGAVSRHLLIRSQETNEKSKTFALPKGKVLLLGILCFIVFMGEGSVTDWSGILMTDFRHVELKFAGLGYVAFAAMMTLNRLTGDIVVAKLGRRQVALVGSSVGALGFFMAALVPHWFVSVVGFAMVGIGLANVVPILFNATGNQTDMSPNLALSSVTTMGYLGLLVGPPMLGFIAHQTSLIISLLFLGGLCVVVAVCAIRVTDSPNS